MTTNYIPVNSVLYDLSLTLDERYWNEAKFAEWLIHGLRQINIESLYVDKVAALEVVNHKATLPSDFKYLTQVAYYLPTAVTLVDSDELDAPSNYNITVRGFSYPWKAMRLSSSPYHNSICLDRSLYNCDDCQHSFSVSSANVITTTLNAGDLLVAYKGFPTEDGLVLMPNDETLKEALFHYALYRYWLAKYQMKESGAQERMLYHENRWLVQRGKSLSLNNPDLSQLENLNVIQNRLTPRANMGDQMYLTLSNK